MNRYILLKIGIVLALVSALSVAFIGRPDSAHAAAMASPMNFDDQGQWWYGSNDGRAAQMHIHVTEPTVGVYTFAIQFYSGTTEWDGSITEPMSNNSDGHDIQGPISLNPLNGGGALDWQHLFLHTWDINYLSGVTYSSTYNAYYGMSFTRGTYNYVAGSTLTSPTNFSGDWTGNVDGKPAVLQISVHSCFWNAAQYSYTIYVTIDGTEYEGSPGVYACYDSTHWNTIPNITLNSFTGDAALQWIALYLHDWDTNYLSGASVWQGMYYGMSFTRAS